MKKGLFLGLVVIISIGFMLPEPRVIPVADATARDWNANTFWFSPWGTSGVHKGIDIFAKQGTPVLAATNQVILYRGVFGKGGKVILALGSKWRLHYYAHLAVIKQDTGRFVLAGTPLGSVGHSGNAQGKPAHLHYSLVSLLPMPWCIDSSSQGYKKAFYLDPIAYLTEQ